MPVRVHATRVAVEAAQFEVVRTLPPDKQADVLQDARQLSKAKPKGPRKSGRGLWRI